MFRTFGLFVMWLRIEVNFGPYSHCNYMQRDCGAVLNAKQLRLVLTAVIVREALPRRDPVILLVPLWPAFVEAGSESTELMSLGQVSTFGCDRDSQLQYIETSLQ